MFSSDDSLGPRYKLCTVHGNINAINDLADLGRSPGLGSGYRVRKRSNKNVKGEEFECDQPRVDGRKVARTANAAK